MRDAGRQLEEQAARVPWLRFFLEHDPLPVAKRVAATPVLILHGDKDKLVPIQQARLFEKRCQETGAPFKLIVREGRDHGWPEMAQDMTLLADWFDQHLRGLKPKP